MMDERPSGGHHNAHLKGGRTNQKLRTQRALIDAARELVRVGERPTVAKAARLALVSDATAYRYFPNQAALVREALFVPWPGAKAALADVPDDAGPADRMVIAAEALIAFLVENEAAVRTVMGLALLRSAEGEAGRLEARAMRPGHRLGLIEVALEPFTASFAAEELHLLKRALVAIVSSEALLTLKDHCGIGNEDVVAVITWATRRLVESALGRAGDGKAGVAADTGKP